MILGKANRLRLHASQGPGPIVASARSSAADRMR